MRQTSDTGGKGAGGSRANALWGGRKGKRQYVLLGLIAALAVMAGRVDVATASQGDKAYVPQELLDAAAASPKALFNVIVQGSRGSRSTDVVAEVGDAKRHDPGAGVGVRKRFFSIAGTSAQLTGRQILRLSKRSRIKSITLDTRAQLEANNSQKWPEAADVTAAWNTTLPAGNYPTIAIVDSGVANGRPEFGSRFLGQINFAGGQALNSTPVAGSDGRGHGTLAASIAANGGYTYAGAEPNAKLLSLDVLDDAGLGYASDIIAACDWILQNKNTYNIRVANFSLNAGGTAFYADPIDQAVERLWQAGIVVVVASGNYGVSSTSPTGVHYAPANDPFVITVGASGTKNTTSISDDYAAYWSAWGYTNEGFFKPEVSAPGRWMRGAVPTTSTMLAEFPGRASGAGNMWMSGTSFAAPVVSGVAATIIANHPSWTPDQVKGAIMLSAAQPTGYSGPGALGVGVVRGSAAVATAGVANPNAALNQFLVTDPATGAKVFNAASWSSTASANASWASASWSSASWSSASWSSASWASASWASASWASASWSSGTSAQASWASNSGTEPAVPEE
ncbi:MAG: S8 family serine peptidase [Gaiella sp.]